jgi:hypothetical protein
VLRVRSSVLEKNTGGLKARSSGLKDKPRGLKIFLLAQQAVLSSM